MAAAPVAQQNNEHGLTYEPDFLSSLPVLSPPMATSSCSSSDSQQQQQQPFLPHLPQIRALTASQFADMHLRYVTTHAPDSVIFPFLHGLEGDNDAQNAFFYANGSMATFNGSSLSGKDGMDVIDKEKLKARVPRFRGLMWVASDEDEVEEYERALKLRRQSHHQAQGSNPVPIHSSNSHVQPPHGHDDLDDDLEDDIEEDDYSTSSLDDDDGEDEDFAAMQMDIDDHVDLNAGVVGMDVDLHGQHGVSMLEHGEGTHMHPVVHAHRPALSAIDTGSKGTLLFELFCMHPQLPRAHTSTHFLTSSSYPPLGHTLRAPHMLATH
ncbi:hypothetical protein BC835DRAFT_951551 [Cytidiella melzeri]|nr:hypothetical protein BC835DRAFT_951551 [Cytidiella melzeri]